MIPLLKSRKAFYNHIMVEVGRKVIIIDWEVYKGAVSDASKCSIS